MLVISYPAITYLGQDLFENSGLDNMSSRSHAKEHGQGEVSCKAWIKVIV